MPKFFRRGFDSYVLLVGWSLWKERNARTFQARATYAQRLAALIKDEAGVWCEAGNGHLATLLRVQLLEGPFRVLLGVRSLLVLGFGFRGVTSVLPCNLSFELSSA